MSNPEQLFESVAPKLEALAKSNAVVGPITEVGNRFAVPLVELSLGLAGAGGAGEGDDPKGGHGKGLGAAAGGGAKVTPVAVVIVEAGQVRIEALGH